MSVRRGVGTMARGRPRKALLSRELIVDTALAQICAGKALSLSAVARELSVHVSSLYNYVRDRDGLIEQLRLRTYEEHPPPSLHGLQWQDCLRAVASTLYQAFDAYPGLVPYFATTPLSAPEVMAVYTKSAEVMVDAGHSFENASMALRMLDSFALGSAIINASEPTKWGTESVGARVLSEAETTWQNDREQTSSAFYRGVEQMIAGLETELESSPTL